MITLAQQKELILQTNILPLYETIFVGSRIGKGLAYKYALTAREDAGVDWVYFHSPEAAQLVAYGCVLAGPIDTSLKLNELIDEYLAITDCNYPFNNRDEDQITVECIRAFKHLIDIDPDLVFSIRRDFRKWLDNFEVDGDAQFLHHVDDLSLD